MSLVEGRQLARFFKKETPSGTVNGSNVTFTLSLSPLENDAVLLYIDGLLETAYSLSGTTITMTTAPANGQSISVYYVQKVGGS